MEKKKKKKAILCLPIIVLKKRNKMLHAFNITFINSTMKDQNKLSKTYFFK